MKTAAALLLLGFLASAHGNDFFVEEPSMPLEVRDNEALELTCTGSQEWEYCKWNFYDKSCSR